MKEAAQIYEQMLQIFEEKTGFRMEDTADLAVRLYAAAAQIETLYAYADWALVQSFPQTATGKYLDYHAQLRGVTRQAGKKAGGTLRFRIDAALLEDLPVPAGTVCTTAGLVRFVTTEDGVIEAGNLYTDVPAEAEQPGPAGNVSSGSIVWMTKAPTGVAGVTNPAAFTGGGGQEDDDALRERVVDSFVRLPNGANAAFYELRALSHPGAGAVAVIPRYQGIGTVGVVVASASGEADAALIARIQADLDAVREIAVDVTVMAPVVKTVDVALTLWPKSGVAFDAAKQAVQSALEGYFTGRLLGKSVYLAALGSIVYATGLVENYVIAKPAADLAGEKTVLPRLGALTITEGA